MRRAYKFPLRPTGPRIAALSEMLADHCSLYNGALRERRDACRHASKTVIRYGDQSAQLKEIRVFDPHRQGRWSFSSQQATLRRLDKAFVAFFRRVRAGATPGYPRFKGVGRFDTVEFPKDGDGCRWDATPHDPVTRVRFQGVGHVRVHQHRPVQGRVKTVSVKREGKRWYVVLACDGVPAEPLPETGGAVGIDMGVVHFLTTSEGEHIGITGMTRAPEPKPDPDNNAVFLPNGARAKAGLGLAGKAESAGRRVIPVDARNTSRTCPRDSCGHVAKENRPTQRRFCCARCGYTDHADRVGALNILHRAGLALPDAA